MEANVTGETRGLYGPGGTDLNGIGRGKGVEWDLNDWRWDGDLFLATPVNAVSSDCRNKQLIPIHVNGELPSSHDRETGVNVNGKVDSEKRRRVSVVEEVDEPDQEESASFTLKLGRQVYPITEPADCADEDGSNSKRSKLQAGNSNRGVCQVMGCGADLSDAKDYHRRHKVCEMHAKATKALVGNVMQRFCQQCSRFHTLQEFDEGKRSCRRRLAGHNRRRRKTHPDAVNTETSLVDTQAQSYILISLIRILSNLQSNASEQSKQQDLLTHFFSSLANLVGSVDARKLSALLEASQNQDKFGNSAGTSSEAARVIPSSNGVSAQAERDAPCPIEAANASHMQRASPPAERSGVRDFDLNDICNDEHLDEEPEMAGNTKILNMGSPNCPPWLLQNPQHQSPPQTSGTSNSASDGSLGSSSGDEHSRTGRIVFKLFGKDPNDFPLDLRRQMISWLSSTPTDIESYIRPGCIILTVYLHLGQSRWENLCRDPKSSLRRLIDLTDGYFWKSGWVYVRWQHLMAFIYNGHIVLEAPLLVDSHKQSKILSVSPVAVPFSTRINFTVKGFELVGHSQRLLCAFDGNYLVQEPTHSLVDGAVNSSLVDGAVNSSNMLQSLHFSCDTPNVTGRGFVEIEDHGLAGVSFPFIVAEPEVCTEIRSLESTIHQPCPQQYFVDGSAGAIARAQALDFLDEMGWLLCNCRLMSKATDVVSPLNLFSLSRFKWLIVFSLERDWLAVVKKLLDIFVEGAVNLSGRTSEDALKEVALLHHAVRCNSKRMVELLLRYMPQKCAGHIESKKADGTAGRFLFRPDMVEVGDITPLHLAASRMDAIDVLDALTNDPGQIGILAWKTAQDCGKSTPEDYARSRGLSSYLRLVEKKINEKSINGHVLDIPLEVLLATSSGEPGFTKMATLIDRSMLRPKQAANCRICSKQQLAYINRHRSSLLYRPAMLSLVGIAAVCVCVGLLLKGPPEVRFVLLPFRWESLDFGSI